MKICELTTNDAQLLSELWNTTFRQAYSDVHTEENIRAYCAENFSEQQARDELNDQGSLCKAIWDDGAVVGYYVLKLRVSSPYLSTRSAELKQIYLLSVGYGKGLGRELFEDASKELLSREFDWVWLSVSNSNYRAQAFYKKLGFKRFGDGPVFQVGTDALSSSVLAKEL